MSIYEWRPVANFPDYQISEDGKVRSKNHILKPCVKANGYFCYTLRKEGRPFTLLLHRLLAQTFIPNPFNLPQINHIDGNKLNNSIENLEWSTPLLNTRHSREVLKKCLGEEHGNSVLTNENILEIRSSSLSCRKLARKLGVNKTTIQRVRKGITWSHIE